MNKRALSLLVAGLPDYPDGSSLIINGEHCAFQIEHNDDHAHPWCLYVMTPTGPVMLMEPFAYTATLHEFLSQIIDDDLDDVLMCNAG